MEERPSAKAEGGSLKRAQQLAREGAHMEALEEIDSYLKPHAKAAVSVEAVQAAAAAVRMANELALGSMRDASSGPQLESSYAYLKWALKAPHASPALRAVTLNNAGIYYARNGNPDAALRCLERVGKQGGTVVEDDVSVHVMLNMTTVLADLGRHTDALEKAQDAVRALTRGDHSGAARADASLLSAAYHNLAVQQERLGNTRGHVRSYRAAVLQARKGGKKSAPMADFMTQAYSNARTRSVNQLTTLVGTGNSLSGSPSASGKTLLPPVDRKPRLERAGAAVSRGSKDVPSLSAQSGLKRRKPGTVGGSLVSVDDLYAGNTNGAPPSAAPLQGSSPIPPIRVAAQGTAGEAGGKQHAPRSAETATISSMPAAMHPGGAGAMSAPPTEAEIAQAEVKSTPTGLEAAQEEGAGLADVPLDTPEPPPSPPPEAAPELPEANLDVDDGADAVTPRPAEAVPQEGDLQPPARTAGEAQGEHASGEQEADEEQKEEGEASVPQPAQIAETEERADVAATDERLDMAAADSTQEATGDVIDMNNSMAAGMAAPAASGAS